ncbi:hypothetical protein [Naumannella huperziae]
MREQVSGLRQPPGGSAYRTAEPSTRTRRGLTWPMAVCRLFIGCTVGLFLGVVASGLILDLADAPRQAPTFSGVAIAAAGGAVSGAAAALLVPRRGPVWLLPAISTGLCALIATCFMMVTAFRAPWYARPEPLASIGTVLMIIVGHAVVSALVWRTRGR